MKALKIQARGASKCISMKIDQCTRSRVELVDGFSCRFEWRSQTIKPSSLLPTNSDASTLSLNQALSEFVGRRAGDEGVLTRYRTLANTCRTLQA